MTVVFRLILRMWEDAGRLVWTTDVQQQTQGVRMSGELFYGARCAKCSLPYLFGRGDPKAMFTDSQRPTVSWTCANVACGNKTAITVQEIQRFRLSVA